MGPRDSSLCHFLKSYEVLWEVGVEGSFDPQRVLLRRFMDVSTRSHSIVYEPVTFSYWFNGDKVLSAR